jgi:hypothetical protein
MALGANIVIRINVIQDDDAGVLVATSPDIKGLIVESDTFEQLQAEIKDLLPEFLTPNKTTNKATTDFHLTTGISFV